jgi:preprotein translocase subunit SecB
MAQSTSEPAAGAAPAVAPQQQQQLIINAQYLKDLSFESPRTPQILLSTSREPPAVSINVDVKARSLGPDVYEVVLTVAAEARQGDDPVFLVELAYAAVLTLRQAAPEAVPLLVFVETPRLMFPFARAIIANATRDGGFPPLLLNPVDFVELLRRERERAGKEGNGQGSLPPAPSVSA